MPFSAPASSVFASNAAALEDLIASGTALGLMNHSKFYENVVSTSANVEQIFGKDWLYNKVFSGGQTGYFVPDGNESIYGPGSTNLGGLTRLNQFGRAWPDPRNSANRRDYRWSVPLAGYLGVLDMSYGDLLLDSANFYAGVNRSVDKLEGFISNIVGVIGRTLYQSSVDTGHVIATVAAAQPFLDSGAATTSGDVIKVTLTEQVASKFNEGMAIDFLYPNDPDGTATAIPAAQNKINVGQLALVVGVDPAQNAITVAFADQTNFAKTGSIEVIATNSVASGVQIPVGAQIVAAESTQNNTGAAASRRGIFGIDDYYKRTGAILGDKAVGTGTLNVSLPGYEHFKSLIQTYTTATPLTRRLLRQYCTRFSDMHMRDGHEIGLFVTTQGVLDKYIDEQDANTLIEAAPGMTRTVNDGYDTSDAAFRHNGKTVSIMVDNHVSAGTLWGHVNDNWMRVVPPGIASTQRLSNVPGAIPVEAVATMVGLPTNLVPTFDVSGTVNRLTGEAYIPIMCRMQHVPKVPVGFKATGLAEDRLAYDALA